MLLHGSEAFTSRTHWIAGVGCPNLLGLPQLPEALLLVKTYAIGGALNVPAGTCGRSGCVGSMSCPGGKAGLPGPFFSSSWNSRNSRRCPKPVFIFLTDGGCWYTESGAWAPSGHVVSTGLLTRLYMASLGVCLNALVIMVLILKSLDRCEGLILGNCPT